jgi:hypothetical protein
MSDLLFTKDNIVVQIWRDAHIEDTHGQDYPEDWQVHEVPAEPMWFADMDYSKPYELPVVIDVPSPVSAAQARLALLDANLLTPVTQLVGSHPLEAVRVWFQYAYQWHYDHPYVQALAAELNLSDAQVRNLFVLASLK